jgi:acyl carrier protein
MSEELRNKVKQVIAAEFGEPVKNLAPDTRFFEDLFGDSLDEISLACALEDEFAIKISGRDARKLLTVKDVCDYVERRVAQEAVTL